MSASPATPRRSFRGVVGGFMLISASTLLAQLIGFVALAVTSRRVGPMHLGAYTFAYGVATYFMLPVNTGLGATAVREVAEDDNSAVQVMAEVALLQAVVTVVSFGLLLALAHLIVPSDEARALLPIAALTVLLQAIAFDWVVQARQSYSLLSAARLLGQVVFGVMVVALVTRGFGGVRWYAWANTVGVAIVAGALLVALWRTGLPHVRIVIGRARLLRRLRASLSMGTVLTLNQIYYSIDSTILGYFKGTSPVGQYGVAYKIPLALIAFINVWNNTLYAHAATLVHREPDTVRSQISLSITVAIAAGLPMICGAAFLGDQLMSTLFGHQFQVAGAAFAVLVSSTAVYMIWVNLSAVTVAAGKQRHYAWAVLCGTTFNIPVNVAVIPFFGMVGAAAVTVATEVIITVYLWNAVRGILGSPRIQFGRLGRAALATAGMASVLAATASLQLFIRLAIAIAVYLMLAAVLRVVTLTELRRARSST